VLLFVLGPLLVLDCALLHMVFAEVGDGFWNIKGSFKTACSLATQMSLIRLLSNNFIVVDAIDITPSIKEFIDKMTDNGSRIEAVLATHQSHLKFIEPFYKLYPRTKYYGTPLHLRGILIPWDGSLMNYSNLQLWEKEGLYLRFPIGAEFVQSEASSLYSAVFVFHMPSATVHVNDTIVYFDKCGILMRLCGKRSGRMEFCPSLEKGLHHTASGPDMFRAFISDLIVDWDFDNICTTTRHGNLIGGAKRMLYQTLQDSLPTLERLSRKWASYKHESAIGKMSTISPSY
jgi:hypothetical protein